MAPARSTSPAKAKRLKAAAVASPPAPKGIPGGGNFSGRIQTTEPNALLREQAGFGRAGTQSIGEFADLALTNPYVTAGLDFICAPIADARIDVEVDEETPLGKQQGDFLKWALTERFRLSNHNDAAARGFLVSGFALFEPRAELVPCPVLGRDVFALAALEQRLPNSLSPNAWREDGDGRLDYIEQQGPKGGSGVWTTVKLPAAQTLLYSWKRTGNNWPGESQLRSVWYIGNRIMPLLLKLVGVTAQREGAGLPVAFAKDDKATVTPQQRDELMTFFANVSFHESSGIVLPTGFDVKWILSPGSNKNHILDLWNSLGQAILLQLGAQQLTLGMGETGSRSVGEVHDARAMAFVRKVLSFEEQILNGDSGESHSGLVGRLLGWNGLLSPDGSAPRVKLTPKRPELDIGTLGTAVAAFKAAGLLTVRLEDENVIREKLSLGPISEEEYAEEKEKAAEKAAAIAKSMQPAGPGAEDDEADAPGPKQPFGKRPPALSASAQRAAWKPWRALRASEQGVKFGDINAYFDNSRIDFERRMRPLVVLMLSKAAPALDAAMADGVISPQEISSVPLAMGPVIKALGKYLAEVRGAGAKFLREELAPKLRAAGEDDDTEEEIKLAADKVIEAQKETLAKRMEARLRAELAREAIDVLRTGGDAEEVWARTVAQQIDSGAFRADAGTVTTKAFNVGRDEAARIMGGIAEVEVSAILDSETCDVCEALDGTTADFGSAEHDRLTPPMRDCAGRDNCRCLLIMIPERGGE